MEKFISLVLYSLRSLEKQLTSFPVWHLDVSSYFGPFPTLEQPILLRFIEDRKSSMSYIDGKKWLLKTARKALFKGRTYKVVF